jgi:hypothetical protein
MGKVRETLLEWKSIAARSCAAPRSIRAAVRPAGGLASPDIPVPFDLVLFTHRTGSGGKLPSQCDGRGRDVEGRGEAARIGKGNRAHRDQKEPQC